MNILVIDDDADLLEVLSDILEDQGHKVDSTESPVQAIEMAQQADYDFVFVDYRMPKYDGVWFMKEVELPRTTKALLMTAHVDRTVIKQMFALGVVGYITKPFDSDEITRHLEYHSSGDPTPPTEETTAANA